MARCRSPPSGSTVGWPRTIAQRRERLTQLLGDMLAEAHYFVAGQRAQAEGGGAHGGPDGSAGIPDQKYLQQNGLPRRSTRHPSALQEIQAVLRSNDIGQQTLAMQMDESNPAGHRGPPHLCRSLHLKQPADRPARHDREAVRRAAVRLARRRSAAAARAPARRLGEISLMMDGALVPLDKAYEALTTPSKRRKIVVVQRKTPIPRRSRTPAPWAKMSSPRWGRMAKTPCMRSCAPG